MLQEMIQDVSFTRKNYFKNRGKKRIKKCRKRGKRRRRRRRKKTILDKQFKISKKVFLIFSFQNSLRYKRQKRVVKVNMKEKK